MEYLFVFLFSIILANCAQNYIDKNKKIGVFYLSLSLLLPCILAAVRNTNIGIDVEYYVLPYYEEAVQSRTLGNYFSDCVDEKKDLFFALLAWLGKFADGPWAFMFIIQLMISLPLYIAIYVYRRSIKYWAALSFFYLIFFNTGLCVMRQLVSASLLICAYSFLKRKNYLIVVLFVTLSILTHHSAMLIALIVFVIYYLCESKGVSGIHIILAAILGVYFFSEVSEYFIQKALIDEIYVERAVVREDEASLSVKALIYFAIVFLMPFIFIKELHFRIINLIAIIGYLFLFLGMYSSYFGRIGLSFQLFGIISVPYALLHVPKKIRSIANICFISLSLFYWYVAVVEQSGWGTYPFEFYKFK